MKIKIRDIVSVSIFSVLLFVSAALIRPAYMNLYTNIELLAKNLKNGLEEKTSLKISYKSLSPSILSSLYIREIKLETEEGDKIASIDKIKLDYRLFSILKGDFDKGFKLVSANGVTVDVSSVVKVYSILGLENKEPVTKEKKVLDLSSFKATLPVNIILKDVSLVYKDEKVRASVICNKISANANSRSDQINLDMNAILKAVTKKGSYSSGFKLSGSLYDGFENSNANISLSELTDGNLTLNRLNFLLGYKNNVVSAATIRNTFPLVINAEYNTANMTSKAVVRANDLTLAKVFKVSKQNDILKRAGEIRLSSLTNMSFSFEDKALCYDSETSVLFPENLVPGGLKTSLVLDGTDKKMNIRKISADGLNYEASGSLDVVFQTLGVSGAVDITKVVLPNGNEISSSIYFDPLKKGFMAFAPQLFIGESALTALQLSLSPSNDSFDFSFEVYDYSHIDSDIPGKIQIDGSYLLSSKYIQSSAAVNSFYLDSGLKISSNFLNQGVKENISGLTHTAEDFMFSADAYFTTDLKSLSFNVPYILIANTKKDNQALMLSFDGNEQSVNLSQADLIYGKQALHASASLDTLPGSNDLFFVSEIIYNSIPYRYSGTFTDNVVSVSGDYSTEVRLDFSKLPVISGNVEFENFPIPVMDTSFIFSLDSGFVFNANNDFSIVVNKFETEEAGNYLGFRPHLSANGNVNRYGARFNTISYSDIFSSLDGSADFVLNLMDDVFSSAAFSLNMQNSRSDENVSVDMNVSNPEMLPFGLNALKNDFYVDASVLINRLNMNRFTKVASDNNELTASLYMTGTAEHPSVTAGIEKLTLMVSGDALNASGALMVEDKDISINEVNVKFRTMEVNNVTGNFSLSTLTGSLKANIDAWLGPDTVHIPLILESSDVFRNENKFIPEEMTVSLKSDGIYGSLIKKPLDFSLSLMYTPELISIFSSENMGLFGYLKKDGEVYANMNSPGIASFNLTGLYKGFTNLLSVNIKDVNINVKNLFSYINFDNYVNFYNGMLTGSVDVGGSLENPDFMGKMDLTSFEINIPTVIPEHIFADSLKLNFNHNEIYIPPKQVTVKKNKYAVVTGTMFMDKWKMDHIEMNAKTAKSQYIPVNLTTQQKMFSVSGETSVDLDMYLTSKDFDITGNVNAEKAEVYINLTKMIQELSKQVNPAIYVNTAIDISMGTHVRLNVDPLLRTIFVPNGKLKLSYDQRSQEMIMDGTLLLKSGDVSYLNRNFYIKEGAIKFTPKDEGFNPLITVRAETREKDTEGESVTIVLTAINQYLNDFTPKFSSIPAKSEVEIQTLLGQIVTADSDNVGNFIFAAGDYAIQSLVGRKLENKLRDLFNSDIFSLRTNVIQNTLSYSFVDSRKKGSGMMNAGNLFDNSTVYIGKYLGSALYVDAMLNLHYDEKRVNDITTAGGLLFQPEFGLELESPFGNIRWNVAPDIDAMLHKQYIPSSSLTLSWKFAF